MMKNITKIGYEEHAKLNKVIIRTKTLPMIIIYMVAVLAFALYGVIVKNLVIAIVGFSIVVFFPLLSYLFLSKKIKSTYEKYKSIYETIHYEFEFNEDKLHLTLIQKDSRNELVTEYEKLSSVIETKDYIFLFIDSRRAYIVNIKGFEHFDRVEFRSLVQTKVKRYKIIGK